MQTPTYYGNIGVLGDRKTQRGSLRQRIAGWVESLRIRRRPQRHRVVPGA